MRCPYCGSENNRVVDSRPFEADNSIRRRRICEDCEKRFTTFEKVESVPLMVVKKDNTREQYDRSKIENGILRSCNKRPVSVDEITRVVDEIEKELFNREEREVESTEIGELVMEKLKGLDQVSYVRFASVYREFKDVNTFMDELKKLLQ
ncbi:MAG: transcriptional regulator NrdR [Lachnospiraceae bacterium]|nr:transcriptional regulator NrdR [Lachnospiraceae bacterium]